MRPLILACLVTTLYAGCSQTRKDVAVSELIGAYEMKSKGVVEEIELRRDGSYSHAISWNGRSRTQQGEWSVQRAGGSTWVKMSRFDTSGWPEDLPGSGQMINIQALATVDGERVTLSSGLDYRSTKRE
jgi:hypothetical protein